MCYALQLGYDDASDAAYNDGWQAGDDGGTGILGAWDFSGTYNTPPPGQQGLDDGLKTVAGNSSPYNDIGRAWTVFNANASNVTTAMPSGTTIGPDNPPSTGTDISQPGRAIIGGLPVGATLKMVIDNPTERRYYRGWTIKLNNGGASGCFNGDNCTTPNYDPGSITKRMGIGTFEYFTYGKWYADWTGGGPPLFDTDTDAGMRIEFTLTAIDTFNLSMIPLDNPGNTYTTSGTMTDGTGKTIDWIEFEFYNTDSDYYPQIAPGDPVPGDYNSNGRVDAADYVLWRKGGPLANEVDTPGTVNAADYTEWRARFGNFSVGDVRATDFYVRSIEIVDGAGSGGGNGAVPEPGTFTYLVIGTAGALLGTWRRGRRTTPKC
jgi:hypothetical protein